jgi:nicotinamidase-related amidase
MSLHVSLRSAWPRSWLVCLDLQREFVVPGRPLFQPEAAAVVGACGRIIRRARHDGWNIVHAHRRRPDGLFGKTGLFSAPIEGLRPLISEPIFVREALSAFANTDFGSTLSQARGDDVYLIGFSLADSCLATALDAIDEGLRLNLVADALGRGGSSTTAAETASGLKPYVRLVSSSKICAQASELTP